METDNTKAIKELAENLGLLEQKQPQTEEPAPEPEWHEFVAESPCWNETTQGKYSHGVKKLAGNLFDGELNY